MKTESLRASDDERNYIMKRYILNGQVAYDCSTIDKYIIYYLDHNVHNLTQKSHTANEMKLNQLLFTERFSADESKIDTNSIARAKVESLVSVVKKSKLCKVNGRAEQLKNRKIRRLR